MIVIAETYCGKRCSECALKGKLNCPGCKEGPGRQYSGDCQIAECCRYSEYDSCSTCKKRENCSILKDAAEAPEKRLQKLQAENAQNALNEKRIPILNRELPVLFWTMLATTAASLLTTQTVMEKSRILFLSGQTVGILGFILYGIVLIRMGKAEQYYRTAGICSLIAGTVNTGFNILTQVTQLPGWATIITVCAEIVSIWGCYHEYAAHSEVLWNLNPGLGKKWNRIWYCHLGVFLVMVINMIITLFSPMTGVTIMMLASMAILVIGIFRLFFLYKTMVFFRNCRDSDT